MTSRGTTVRRTRRGWRLSRNGTVLSEILLQPGATGSVFDLLAAACHLHPAPRHIAFLGFAGGATLAPLRALGIRARVHGIDLDQQGYNLLVRNGPVWVEPLSWTLADAVTWLSESRRRFDVIVEDLSVPRGDDVEKPEATWGILPELVAERLASGGIAIFNLLRPQGLGWNRGLAIIRAPFRHAFRTDLSDYHNRLVIGVQHPLETRALSRSLRESMTRIRSDQTDRFRIRRLPA